MSGSEPKDYPKSRELYERACGVLAGGISSEFRRYNQPHPLFYTSGSGSHIVDVDGNDYLDFTLSQGPLILGHSHPEVLAAVNAASSAGQLFAGQHLAELELAERLQQLIPCAELVRFSLSGSEAVHAALRLARAATGRPKFLRFEGHYHGWLDNVAVGIGGTESQLGERKHPHAVRWSAGLPAHIEDESLVLPWNDLDLVERALAAHHAEIAAVITEPVMCNSGCIPPVPGFLQGLRELCDRYGVLLIFDEVITGFRVGLGGAQERFDILPDLAIFGKAMASGYPISALVGQKRWMQMIAEGTVIHAGTMNAGNPSVAAALATLTVLERNNVHARLADLGQRLLKGLVTAAQVAGLPVLAQGPGPMFHLGFTKLPEVCDYRDTLSYDKALYARFVLAMQLRGIRLIGRGLWYLSAAHTEAEIDHCLAVAGEVFGTLRRA
jgi:glutamate-1-semialdehyde 2,1-aminomutase